MSHFQSSSCPRINNFSLNVWHVNTEPIVSSETSITNYQHTPRNIPEELRYRTDTTFAKMTSSCQNVTKLGTLK